MSGDRVRVSHDRLRGIGRNTERPAPVHRERVRFGAWEVRPRSRARASWRVGVWREGHEVMAEWRDELAGVTWIHRQAPQDRTEPLAPVPVEGRAIPGPQNAYKCTHCRAAAPVGYLVGGRAAMVDAYPTLEEARASGWGGEMFALVPVEVDG